MIPEGSISLALFILGLLVLIAYLTWWNRNKIDPDG